METTRSKIKKRMHLIDFRILGEVKRFLALTRNKKFPQIFRFSKYDLKLGGGPAVLYKIRNCYQSSFTVYSHAILPDDNMIQILFRFRFNIKHLHYSSRTASQTF